MASARQGRAVEERGRHGSSRAGERVRGVVERYEIKLTSGPHLLVARVREGLGERVVHSAGSRG